ncbi:MAG: type II secretion system F family protein [Anaerolineae bacterium]
METSTLLVIGVVVLIVVVISLMVYNGLRERREVDPLEQRLALYAERNETVESLQDIEEQLSFRDRVVLPLIAALSRLVNNLTPQEQLEQARRKLELAGQTTDPAAFMLQRIVWTVLLGGLGLMLAIVRQSGFTELVAFTGGGVLMGYYFPMLSLNSKIRKRQESIVKALPDALDLLVICVEAGLGFDAAMGKVYEKWDNELALAFGRVLREIQLGKLRRDALKDMALRMDVPDVNSFTAAIIQAEQLGVSMSKILRVQSDQMRVKRRQRAQEKAQQAPVKMMIPMVLLIFPSIWVVLLGPAVLRIMNTPSGGAW